MMLKHDYVTVNSQILHYVHQGKGEPILFLHGFPAFWYVWKEQLARFGQTMWAIALDGRGVNRSSKPTDVASYRIEHLASDVIGLADHLGIEQFALVGHDWGGALAWEVALRYPQRVSRLVVANAPPWAALMFSLATMPEQRAASGYMDRLKANSAESRLLADNANTLWQVSMASLVAKGAYSDEHKDRFIQCWQTPGSLTGFLNWYRANVPEFDEIDVGEFRPKLANQINTPTLLLWGEHERAFTPSLLNIIPDYAPQVEIRHIADANHWIHLEQPNTFFELVQNFVTSEN